MFLLSNNNTSSFKEPKTFREVFGNEGTKVRLKAIARNKEASNFLLLVGPKGHGKSTLSDITAKYYLCDHPTELNEPCCKCPNCIDYANNVSQKVIKVNMGQHSNLQFIDEFKAMISDKLSDKLVIQLEELQEMKEETQGAMLEALDGLVKRENDVLVVATSYKHYKVIKAIRDRAFQMNVGLTSAELKVYVEAIAEKELDKKTINYLLQKKLSPRAYKTVIQNHIQSSLTSLYHFEDYFKEAGVQQIVSFINAFMSPYPQFHSVMFNYTEEELSAIVMSALFHLTRVSMSKEYDAGNKSAGDYSPEIKELIKDLSSVETYRLIYYMRAISKVEDVVNETYAMKYLYEQSKKEDREVAQLREQNKQLCTVIEQIEKLKDNTADQELVNSPHAKKIMTTNKIQGFGGSSFSLPNRVGGATT